MWTVSIFQYNLGVSHHMTSITLDLKFMVINVKFFNYSHIDYLVLICETYYFSFLYVKVVWLFCKRFFFAMVFVIGRSAEALDLVKQPRRNIYFCFFPLFQNLFHKWRQNGSLVYFRFDLLLRTVHVQSSCQWNIILVVFLLAKLSFSVLLLFCASSSLSSRYVKPNVIMLLISLQAFTKKFKDCNPESPLNLACLSTIEEMLIPVGFYMNILHAVL